jgi:hypothetical protein
MAVIGGGACPGSWGYSRFVFAYGKKVRSQNANSEVRKKDALYREPFSN